MVGESVTLEPFVDYMFELVGCQVIALEKVDSECHVLIGDFPCWLCVRTGRKELPNGPPFQLFLSMVRQLTFSDITDQRTLTENASTVTDDTPETPTALLGRARQHATNVDRSTLRRILLSGLEDRVHFGVAATGVEWTDDEAILHLDDGSDVHTSVVVGADGVNSVLRENILPQCPPIDTGYRAIYGKSPLVKDGEALVPDSFEDSALWAGGADVGGAFFFTEMPFHEPPVEVFDRLVEGQNPPTSEDYLMLVMILKAEDAPANMREFDSDALYDLALDISSQYHSILQNLVAQAESVSPVSDCSEQ